MEEKRRMFVFGAGAALEWGAPKTTELTEMILKSGFKTVDNVSTITRFLYQRLIDHGYPINEINFETIISVIEELLVFYSSFNQQKRVPSLLKCFFDSKVEKEIFNFSIEGGVLKHGYKLEIPKGKQYEYSKCSLQNETPEQFFLQHLLEDLITEISSEVIHYSYDYAISAYHELNQSFMEWLNLHKRQTPLRLYTLNYDRIFQSLLYDSGVEIFEGFNLQRSNFDFKIRPNIGKILTDFGSNICYNLHGCINWDVEDLDFHQLPNPEVLFTKFPDLQVNSSPTSVQIEKGKTMMVTNIVTGYQKAQKSMIAPFKQMQSAFDVDCFLSEEIYIIGYSFGDEHINESLRTAIRHSPNKKIIIVDPLFMKNDFDVSVAIKVFSSVSNNFITPQKIQEHVYSHMNGTFIVYSMTFKEFRKLQLNPFNKAAGGIMQL